jgi:hypothetical protein
MDDVLIHLIMSVPRSQVEVDRLFELDAALDDAFPNEYDGNDIGMGEFVIYLRHKNGDALLAAIRPKLPDDLVLPGSHAVIRRTRNEEVTERVVPLAGEPKLAESPEPDRMSIQASAIINGTRNNASTEEVVHRILRLAGDAGKRHPAEFGVDYLIVLAGDVSKLEFEGVRTGSFSKTSGRKSIQIAVPEILEGVPTEFLATRLEEAFALAEQYFKRKQKGVSLDAARQATNEVVAQLRSNPAPKDRWEWPDDTNLADEAIRPEITRLLALGPLPRHSVARVGKLEEFRRAFESIAAPVTTAEAKTLMTLFGPDECFGLAWTLLHLIESAPELPLDARPPPNANEWVLRLWDSAHR